jgi:hypothetical protein
MLAAIWNMTLGIMGNRTTGNFKSGNVKNAVILVSKP